MVWSATLCLVIYTTTVHWSYNLRKWIGNGSGISAVALCAYAYVLRLEVEDMVSGTFSVAVQRVWLSGTFSRGAVPMNIVLASWLHDNMNSHSSYLIFAAPLLSVGEETRNYVSLALRHPEKHRAPPSLLQQLIWVQRSTIDRAQYCISRECLYINWTQWRGDCAVDRHYDIVRLFGE